MTTTPEKFEREHRYIVVKRSELLELLPALDPDIKSAFDTLLGELRMARSLKGKKPFDCVVIESDWTCYAEAWRLVEAEWYAKHGAQEWLRKALEHAGELSQLQPLPPASDKHYAPEAVDIPLTRSYVAGVAHEAAKDIRDLVQRVRDLEAQLQAAHELLGNAL